MSENKENKSLLDEKIAQLTAEAETEAAAEIPAVEAPEAHEAAEEPADNAEVPAVETPEPVEAKEVEAPVYVPNKKFKVHDQEYEFEPEFDPLLKDKVTEEKIRALHAKAYGLEPVMKSRDDWKTKAEEAAFYKDVFAPVMGMFNEGKKSDALKTLFTQDDLKEVIKDMAKSNPRGLASLVNPDELLQAAMNELAYQRSTPEERARIDQEIKIREDAAKLMSDAQTEKQRAIALRKQAEEDKGAALLSQLDLELSNPEIKKIAELVDSKIGKDAFKNEVLKYGNELFHASKDPKTGYGKVTPPNELVKAVHEKYSKLVSGLAPASAKEVKKAAHIPNARSSGSSGRMSKPKSLADISKIQKELES